MIASVSIVIVNWNAGPQLFNCLQSIINVRVSEIELQRVIVVDNASDDGSSDRLEVLSLPFTLIKNAKNLGFAAACNIGAKLCDSDYILFLNPDMRLFPDSLQLPINFMQQPENKKTGICGIQLIDDLGEVSRTCARFPSLSMLILNMLGLDHVSPRLLKSHFMKEWDHCTNRQVEHVIGAFFLVRNNLFKKLNGFDERFFVYLEDLDFSFRALSLGWFSYYLADVQAYHKGGGTSQQIKARRLFYSLRSRILYCYKHFNWWCATALMLGTLILQPLARLVFAILNKSFLQVEETLKGYSMLYRATPRLLLRLMSEGKK